MDLNSWIDQAPAIGAVLAGGTAITAIFRAPNRRRTILKADAEIAAVLPAGPQRNLMLEHIEKQVLGLVEDETQKSRDLGMFTFSVIALALLTFGAITLIQTGQWWGYLLAVPTSLLDLVFFYGVIETGQKASRDDKGNRIK